MQSHLTREIIKKLFANVGVIPEVFGKYGVTLPENLCDFTLDVEYEESKLTVRSPIFAGEIKVGDAFVRLLLIDLSVDGISEYAMVFRNGSNPIYGVKLVLDSNDNGVFMIFDGKSWTDTSTITKCKTVIGFEIIASHGLHWSVLKDVGDLFPAAQSLLGLG